MSDVVAVPIIMPFNFNYATKYTIGQWSVAAARLQSETAGTAKVSGNQIGAAYTTGAWTLGSALTTAQGSKLNVNQVRYALSKRTTAYALYGKTEFEAAEKGESDVTMVGVRHSF